MLYLPALSNGESTWRLPLTNEAAVCLANALLDRDPYSQDRQFRELLRDEPPLLLWCVCRSGSSFHTLPQAARWLARRAVSEMHKWDAGGQGDTCSADLSFIERSANLAVSSIADSLSCNPSDEESYLAALLSKSEAWLELAFRETANTRNLKNSLVPLWLTAAIAAQAPTLKSTKPRVNAKNYIRLAAIKQRWFDSLHQPAIDLPSLLQHIVRLHDLEANFARTLESEKLDSLKELAYGASHEINNPLANIATRAQTLLRDESDPEKRRKLATINAQAFRAHEMISDMMLFARPPQPRFEDCDLSEITRKVVHELTPDAKLQNIQISLEPPAIPMVATVDREQMAVVIKALCRNSLEAIGRDGEVRVELEVCERDADCDEPYLALRVHDSGPGITEEVRRHLFDPFYSGREAGRGLGFGLSKSWRIVTLHRGKIDVESELGEGSTFTVRIPRSIAPKTSVA